MSEQRLQSPLPLKDLVDLHNDRNPNQHTGLEYLTAEEIIEKYGDMLPKRSLIALQKRLKE